MVHQSVIEARLSQLGVRKTTGNKAEIRELQHILMDNEKIVAFATGRYFGGFAVLVATDHRVLLVDKKLLFLTVDDIRYDMISEIDFSSRLLDSTIHLFTVNKQHSFTSMKYRHMLRKMFSYIQQRITEIRTYQQGNSQPIPEPQPTKYHLPSLHAPSLQAPPIHLPKVIGSAALHGTHWLHNNPYTKNALMMRRRGWDQV